MTDWTKDAADILEQLTRDPLRGSVAGTVTIQSIIDARPRPRYQEAELELLAEAPGREPVLVRTFVVLDRRRWPSIGTILPAHIAQGEPPALDISWDILAT